MRSLWGAFRVLGFSLTVLAIAIGLTLRQAEARLAEALRGFGDELTAFHEMRPHSAPRSLMLNGLELKVLTLSTPLEVPAALDRIQHLCHSVAEFDLPSSVRQQLENNALGTGSTELGVIRRDTSDEGFFACLDVGEGVDAAGFLERLKAFGATQNLRSLGQFRYVRAHRTDGRTTLVVFWLEGDANLREVFPKNGDAPGIDLRGVPRPKDSRRRLSAFEQGAPSALALYSIPGRSRDATVAGYRATLHDQGWHTKTAKNGLVIAEKAGRSVLVKASERHPGSVILSLLDLG